MSENNNGVWHCTVCGYIHREKEPPAECPVCGAPKKLFELFSEPLDSVKTKGKSNYWRCMVCNHDHVGDIPPDKCRVCGSSSKEFEQITGLQEKEVDSRQSGNIVIIGGGIAGVSAVESIRKISDNVKITLLSKENFLPYYRLNLSRLLAGEVEQDSIFIHPENWYLENRVDLFMGAEVSDFSTDNNEVTLTDGTTHLYDKLILTAGSHAFMPPLPGIQLEGVTPLRTLSDVNYIKGAVEHANSVVIVGGGILGLEIAGALVHNKKNITVLEHFDYLMPRQLNKKAALLLESYISNLGINLKTKVSVKELAGDERVAGVVLNSGETLPADLVIFSTGVRSNSYLAKITGLNVNQGVIVNDYLKTSNEDIFAAGDIAEHRGVSYGLWNAAQYQGSIAGMNAVGQQVGFGGIPRSNTLKVLGVDLFSIGKFAPEDGSYIVFEEKSEQEYVCFVFHDSHLVGAILYGETVCSAGVKKAIESKKDFSKLLKNKFVVKDICALLKL